MRATNPHSILFCLSFTFDWNPLYCQRVCTPVASRRLCSQCSFPRQGGWSRSPRSAPKAALLPNSICFLFFSFSLSLFFLFLYIRDISISRSLLSMTSLRSQSFHVLFSAGFTGCLGYVDAAPSSIPRIPTGTQRLPRRSLTMEASSQFAGKNHRSSRKWCLWQHENAPIIVHEIFHN